MWRNYEELGAGTWARVASLGHETPTQGRMTTHVGLLMRLQQMSYKKERDLVVVFPTTVETLHVVRQ